MYNFELTSLSENKWHQLVFDWDLSGESKSCSVMDEKCNEIATLPLNYDNVNGINYVHFISTAKQEDAKGFLIEKVESKAN